MPVAITSRITDDPNVVHLSGADFSEGWLPKKSIVKTTKLFTIHSSRIVKKVCTLTREKTEEILWSVREFFSWNVQKCTSDQGKSGQARISPVRSTYSEIHQVSPQGR